MHTSQNVNTSPPPAPPIVHTVHTPPFSRSITSLALHTFTYTSVETERDPLVGSLHVFSTAAILDYLHASTSRILSIGVFDHVELQQALASPITVLGISSSGVITAFATLKDKLLACKNSWIGLPGERSTTMLESCYVSVFGSVRGLRKPFATYVCAVAGAASYKALTVSEPYNIHFVCTKTDVMGSKALYFATPKRAFAPITLTMMQPVPTRPVSDVVDVAIDTYAHICDVEFKEPLFSLPYVAIVPAVVKAVVQQRVPLFIHAFLDDDEAIIAELLEEMGTVIDVAVHFEQDLVRNKRSRSFSLEEPIAMGDQPPSTCIVPAAKRTCMV